MAQNHDDLFPSGNIKLVLHLRRKANKYVYIVQ